MHAFHLVTPVNYSLFDRSMEKICLRAVRIGYHDFLRKTEESGNKSNIFLWLTRVYSNKVYYIYEMKLTVHALRITKRYIAHTSILHFLPQVCFKLSLIFISRTTVCNWHEIIALIDAKENVAQFHWPYECTSE